MKKANFDRLVKRRESAFQLRTKLRSHKVRYKTHEIKLKAQFTFFYRGEQ